MSDNKTKTLIGYSHNEVECLPFSEDNVLFFTLPFNGEQKKVADLLQQRNNCLLKGGPGTGKTQTMINLMIDAMSKGNGVLFTTKNAQALEAFNELFPKELRKYVLVLPEDTGVEDVKLHIKPYLKNLLELLDRTDLDHNILEMNYLSLQETYNQVNCSLVAVNNKIKDVLNLNQQVLTLGGEEHTYQMAFDFINNKKNISMLSFDFAEEDYDLLSKVDWKDLVSKINVLNQHDLKFLEMGENLLTHQFMEFPDELMANYGDLLQKLKKVKVLQESTLRDLNKKEFYPAVVQKFEELKQLMTKYNILLDDKIKQNFIKFFSRRKSLQLIEDPMNVLTSNMDKLVENVSFNVSFPSNLHETEYFKDLEFLAQGGSLDGMVNKLTKKKQKEYFDEVKIAGSSVTSVEQWKKIYDKVVMDMAVRNAILKWNEHANTFGLQSMDTLQPVDIAFTNLKKNVDVFYAVAGAYIQVEQLILPYMDLTGTTLENINTIQTYLNALAERDLLNSRLQIVKSELSTFIQNGFLIPKNLIQAKEYLKFDDFDALSSLFIKEIKEEDSYKPIKEAYIHIHQVLLSLKMTGNENCVKFLKQILESGYGMKMDPQDLTLSIKKTLLNDFVKRLNGATILNTLMDEKKVHTKSLKKVINDMVLNRIQFNALKVVLIPEVSAVVDTIRSLLLRLESGRESKDVYVNILVLLKGIIKHLPAIAMTNFKTLDYIQGNEQSFELLLVDDASQEGFEFLPIVLKGKKVVVAGDDRMYEPSKRYPVNGFDTFKSKYLLNVPSFLYEMITPSASLLDVATSIFYQEKVVLNENLRSDKDVLKFVNSNFYENSLTPLRAKSLDVESNLIDVHITNGVYENKINEKEVDFVVAEVARIIKGCSDLGIVKTIGVISLSSAEQASLIYENVRQLISLELLEKFKFVAGTPSDAQGKERDLVIITMGSSKGAMEDLPTVLDLKVAMTRARDVAYLVRSFETRDLPSNQKHCELLLNYFKEDSNLLESNNLNGVDLVNQGRSEVEKNIMANLIGREYQVKPNADFGKFSIDLLVYDSGNALAIEVEGDVKEKSYCWTNFVKRQLELEEVGWNFYRVLYSQYCSNRGGLSDSIIKKIEQIGIKPVTNDVSEIKNKIKHIVL